jgi:hypothetical protein
MTENAAQILIATVFARLPCGTARNIHRSSTNLSTEICGYRENHYKASIRHHPRALFGALREVARRDGLA